MSDEHIPRRKRRRSRTRKPREYKVRESQQLVIAGQVIRVVGDATLWFPNASSDDIRVEKIAADKLDLSEPGLNATPPAA